MAGVRKQLRESGAAFAAVLHNRALRRLELAWTAAIVGHWAYLVVVSVYAYRAGGEAAVGLIFLLRMLPAAFVAPFSGLLADRYRRERIVVGCVTGRAALVGTAAACVFLGAQPAIVYTLAVVAALVETALRPAQAALTPALCTSPAELTAANAVSSTVESLATFVGPAIAGIMLGLASMGTVFAFTAAMLLVAFLFAVRVRAPEESTPKGELEASTIVAESLAGFRAIGRERPLRVMIGLFTAQTFVAGAVQVYVVVLAIQLLGLGTAGVGYLNSAFGVGAILGGVLALGLTGTRRLSPSFLAGVVLWGVPLAFVGVGSHTGVALVLLGLMGIGNSLVDVAGFTLVQRAVPDDVLARVFGVIQFLWLTSVGAGAFVAPHLLSWVGTRDALLATGLALVALAALFAPRVAAIDAAAPAPDPEELRLLGGVPIFAPLAGATLEHLAARLVPLVAPPGTAVVRQGGPGDRFYIVVEGELEVTADGRTISSLAPGDYFGEIALLRDVPRTATVTARTQSVLYALDRDDFLATVTGYAASAQAAERVASARLRPSQPTEAAGAGS